MRKTFKDVLIEAMTCDDPVAAVRALLADGRIKSFLPEFAAVAEMDSVGHKDVLEHSLGVLDRAHLSDRVLSEITKLAAAEHLDEDRLAFWTLFRVCVSALLHDIGKPVTRILDDAWASRYEDAWVTIREWSWDWLCSRAWTDVDGDAWTDATRDAWLFRDRARFNNHEKVGAMLAHDALLRLGFDEQMAKSVASDVFNTLFNYNASDFSFSGREDRGEASPAQNVERARDRIGGDGPFAGLNLAVRLDLISWDATGKRASRHQNTVNQMWFALDEFARLRAEETAKIEALRPPLSGDDIMKTFGVRPGPHIGAAIAAQRDVLRRGDTLTRDEAIELVKQSLAEHLD